MAVVEPKAKLINYLKEPERNVAVSARLCYSDSGADELMEEMTDKEVNNLVDKITNLGHTSTLEHTYFYFHLVCSRVTSHQLVRQRVGTSYSQRSQRYVNEDNFSYIIPPSIKKDSESKAKYKQMMSIAKKYYNEMIKNGIPEEDARFILPTIKTNIVVSYNARSLLHFFKLRCCNKAQWEIRRLANQMLSQVKNIAPNIFKNAGPPCVSDGECPEGEMSCGRIENIKYSNKRKIKIERGYDKKYVCPYCLGNENFNNLTKLLQHLKWYHPDEEVITRLEDGKVEHYLTHGFDD
jgi:thymidylate synthase (FAD)